MMTTLTMTTRSERVVDGDDDELVAARELPVPPCCTPPSQANPADEDKVPMGKTKRPAALCYNVPMKILFNATRLDETRRDSTRVKFSC